MEFVQTSEFFMQNVLKCESFDYLKNSITFELNYLVRIIGIPLYYDINYKKILNLQRTFTYSLSFRKGSWIRHWLYIRTTLYVRTTFTYVRTKQRPLQRASLRRSCGRSLKVPLENVRRANRFRFRKKSFRFMLIDGDCRLRETE